MLGHTITARSADVSILLEIPMTLIKRKLQTALLLAAMATPIAALAADAPPAATPTPEAAAPSADTSTSQSDRMELVRAMRARMREIVQTQDPDKRKALMEAQINDMAVMMQMFPPAMGVGPGAGMGMRMGPGLGMMGPGAKPNCKMGQGPAMGPGMGMMMGPGSRKHCQMMGQGDNCARHDEAVERRLDALEKRMDMMQTMLRMMAL
jgi:hypothetical protein